MKQRRHTNPTKDLIFDLLLLFKVGAESRYGQGYLVSTNWFKPSVFQTDKENQKCAGGAHSQRTVSAVPVDPTSFSWWWFSIKADDVFRACCY
jgi:hypothetical protein